VFTNDAEATELTKVTSGAPDAADESASLARPTICLVRNFVADVERACGEFRRVCNQEYSRCSNVGRHGVEGEPRDVGTVPGRADSYALPEDLESGKCSGSTFGQSARKRHEHYQSDDRDDDHHDHNPGIAEALSPYHQRGGNIALARTQRKNPPRVIAWSSKQPSNAKT